MDNASTDPKAESDVEVELDLSVARSLIANMTFDSNDMVVDLLATLAPLDRRASDDVDEVDVIDVDSVEVAPGNYSDLDVRVIKPTS